MPSKEIKELRQSGRLEEALIMAQAELEAKPENILGKRNISWVYYEYLKKYSSPEFYDLFKENLIKIKELDLFRKTLSLEFLSWIDPENDSNLQLPKERIQIPKKESPPSKERMIFDNCAWQIGSMVFALKKEEHVDYSKINELFEIIQDFEFSKPSEAYSFIYKAFHKGYQNWSKYIEFADWWNLENFRSQDYLKEEFNNKKIMALAEQSYIAYSKVLIEGEPLDAYGVQRRIDTEKIKSFLPKLDAIIDKHPEYQYPPYFKAKLLLTLGDEDNVLEAFLPFAKQKRNDFWVWELMAEIYADNDEIKFACYCKALSLNTPEDFLVKIRQTFASMLIDKQMFPEAKTELEKIIVTRESHQWRLSNQLTQWIEQDWFNTTRAKLDNKDLYARHIITAEEILFQDIPEEIIAVEFVNHSKNMLNFIIDRQNHGFFKYPKDFNPKIGELLKVRFDQRKADGFQKTLTIKKSEVESLPTAIQDFDGNISISPQNSFGFVDHIFVDPAKVKEYNLNDGKPVRGKAILSYNKKNNDWGWKCFEIIN